MTTPYAFIPPRRRILVAAVLSTLIPIAAFAQTATPVPAPTASADRDDALMLSTFTVTENQDLGYESMHTTSGMRTVQELKNVASSISIMNSQFMEDIGAIDMEEMSKWLVTGEANPDPAIVERGIFRGIVNSFAIRNGWIWYSPMDAYATERVEVLRGPNAFLYGEADLGGANNQITKRGRFLKNTTRAKLMVGSDDLLRGELDINRILIKNKLAVRVAGVQSKNGSWIDHVRREFRGIYGAVTYKPFAKTTISLMAEKAKNTPILSQGLFLDQFSRTDVNVPASGGYVYIPATGTFFRAQGAGQRRSRGSGSTIIDPSIVPKTWQSNGPNATIKTNYETFTIEAEHHIGDNLHLQLSGNWYANKRDHYTAVGRNVYLDRNPTLPNGQPNPYFGEFYTEYFRARQIHGGQVRDMRLSAVYDLETKWMKQQIVLNLQQHQDTPGHWKPTWGEYLSPSHPAFVGAINPEPQTRAQHVANRTTFTNNRFMRRYYFKDGNGSELTGDLGPVPGVSAWYPDLGNAVPAGGEQTYRRFYTPSVGVGASGSYFNNHLFTLVGFRRDHFNMKTRFGTPRPIENTWQVDEIDALNVASPFVQYKVDGTNLGAVFRLNDSLAFAYNRAQSFRISVGEGPDTFRVGERQGIPTGEGEDMSVRLSLFRGKMEATLTRYENYTPNARFHPNPVVAIRDEVSAIFPTTFVGTGRDYQTTTTSGYELEVVANLTRYWRLSANAATNEVVNEDRLPLLKGFQAEARAMNQPTPLLDAFIATFPEGVPNPGYTKTRANLFTRYEFSKGRLKGFYIGGGTNWRTKTFRGNVDLDQDGVAEALWSPSYYIVSLLGGYRTRIADRPTSFAVNINNVLDKDYYLSATNTSGRWGDPRSYRLTIITEF